jgi:pyridoxal biosynthesis lyase PdxS
MKKEDAVSRLNHAGEKINDLNANAWITALNPTRYGWVSSLVGVVSIPVLSAAQIGHLVTSAVVDQVDPDTFERITTLGREPRDDEKR